MTLDELTPWLFGRANEGIRWGVERTRRLLAGVGDPHRHFRSLLIGGTNGKGSVAALCDAALRARSRGSIGLYTSPHLVSFTERIRIDGVPVTEAALVDVAERLRPAIEAEGASFFEATTALAFMLFAEAGVEFAVVEVGLGGRLDATNVLDPEVSVVTNIARDHVEYLGEDLAGIAREKAGIFRSGAPALIGIEDPALASVAHAEALAVGAMPVILDECASVDRVSFDSAGTDLVLSSRFWGDRRLHVPLPGQHQARNAAIAAEALALLPPHQRPEWKDLEQGFTEARWPGRLQITKVRRTTLLFDVAHNPAGAASLAAALEQLELPPPYILVTAILADKAWPEMLTTLATKADAVVLTTAPSAPPSRLWDPMEAAEWSRENLGMAPRVIRTLSDALERASTLAPHGTVIVTGSVHTVGDAMALLGVSAV